MKVMKKAVLAVLIFALVVAVCACAFRDSKKIGEKPLFRQPWRMPGSHRMK